jgi:hypothetical protein
LGVDGSGNVYVVDMLNNRIRKISTSGIITTVAGNGTPSYVVPVPPDGTATQLAESPVYFTVGQDGTINQPKTVCGRSAFRRLFQCLKSRQAA